MASLEKQLKYSNIPNWHKAGITGKGVRVMNLETPGGDGHCEYCTKRLHHAAPDAEVFETGLSLIANSIAVTEATCKYNGKTYDVEEFIREQGIKVLIRSVHGKSVDPVKSAFWNGLKKKYNLVFFSPAGNKGSTKIGASFPSDVAIYSGACSLTDKGVLIRDSYSSVGEELDFMNFTGDLEGTSFASPYNAGIACLFLQDYPDLTQDEVYEILKSISKDMDVKGYDIETGWGIPILGEPGEVIERMVSESTKTNFIKKIGSLAQADMKKTGILASLTIAQAILESGWGLSGLAKTANNLFGIKGSYNGQTTIRATKECYDGTWVTIQAGFRVYPSWGESIADHSNLFNSLSRYIKLRGCKDYKLACKYVYEAGYATDPNYTAKLVNLIEAYKLYEYDTEVEDLTREETLALIKEVLTGKDTTVSDWAQESWEQAKQEGITDGTRPGGYITREQAATMIMRARGE